MQRITWNLYRNKFMFAIQKMLYSLINVKSLNEQILTNIYYQFDTL